MIKTLSDQKTIQLLEVIMEKAMLDNENASMEHIAEVLFETLKDARFSFQANQNTYIEAQA